ncbi:MAG: hypothetical protein AAF848_05895 [Pseudomonadota bacterium]
MRENTKRSGTTYLKYIDRTCRMLGGAELVVFYAQDDVRAAFEAGAARHGIALSCRRVPIAELPGTPYAAELLAGCQAMDPEPLRALPDARREKGLRHLRELNQSGPEAYLSVVAIWVSKVLLMDALACERDEPGHRFTWVDASVSRFRHKRQRWNFMAQRMPNEAMAHYGNLMRVNGVRLPLNASFLSATAPIWHKVCERFEAKLKSAISQEYAHDEETILALCHAETPDLFYTLGDMHGLIRRKLANITGSL